MPNEIVVQLPEDQRFSADEMRRYARLYSLTTLALVSLVIAVAWALTALLAARPGASRDTLNGLTVLIILAEATYILPTIMLAGLLVGPEGVKLWVWASGRPHGDEVERERSQGNSELAQHTKAFCSLELRDYAYFVGGTLEAVFLAVAVGVQCYVLLQDNPVQLSHVHMIAYLMCAVAALLGTWCLLDRRSETVHHKLREIRQADSQPSGEDCPSPQPADPHAAS